MKKFFIQDVKEGSIQSGYLFILINVVWFAGGIAGLDYGNFDNVLQLFWTISLVQILLGLKDLQGDTVPEDWRQEVLKVFSKVLIFETNNKDEVFVMPIIFCGFIVIELA